VKLLRVIQTRTFQRIGDAKLRRFDGKIIAATNRDLAAEMRAGRFRTDFYYRICSDTLEAPSLRERLADDPQELAHLLRFIAERVAGEEAEALAADTAACVARLGAGYEWPGNVRELEQCVRNVLVRGEYRPARPAADGDWIDDVRRGGLRAAELLRRYGALVYEQAGSYEAAARRLGVDRRTVKSWVEARAGEPAAGPPDGERGSR
jgi:DNA-binding NtrC family response regulator